MDTYNNPAVFHHENMQTYIKNTVDPYIKSMQVIHAADKAWLINYINSEITKLRNWAQSNFNRIDSEISRINREIARINSEIARINNEILSLESSITNVESNVSSLDSDKMSIPDRTWFADFDGNDSVIIPGGSSSLWIFNIDWYSDRELYTRMNGQEFFVEKSRIHLGHNSGITKGGVDMARIVAGGDSIHIGPGTGSRPNLTDTVIEAWAWRIK